MRFVLVSACLCALWACTPHATADADARAPEKAGSGLSVSGQAIIGIVK